MWSPMVRKPTVISLFAGCGGSSLGYKMAGFKELLAIDFDKNAVDTFRLNFSEVPIWNRDITTVSGKEILDFCKIRPKELDVLDGSPPCQGFSNAGKRNVNDSRNSLFKEYSRLINELQPKVFVMENVSGMVHSVMKGIFIEIIKELKSLGYVVRCKLLNSANYGVPQQRKRLFFIGVRKDLNKEPVYPIHSDKIITVREALVGVKNKTFQTQKTKEQSIIYPYIKQGEKALNTVPKHLLSKYIPRLVKNKKITFGNLCSRIESNKPARTILKGGCSFENASHIHPTENRIITIEEAKRLSSFPDDFKFIGQFGDQWSRIGNAVMPNQMRAIAETIKTKILEL